MYKISLLILLTTCVATLGFTQSEGDDKLFTYGLTLVGGGNTSNSIGEVISPTFGLGVLMKLDRKEKFFHTLRLSYNIKQEKFINKPHYQWTNGSLNIESVDIVKNYGVIDLSYGFNYYLLKKENVTLFAAAEIGIGDLFWLKTRIDIADSEDEISNGKTQFAFTNPFTRPLFNGGIAAALPYEKDKTIIFKPEIQWDYRLPFSKKTYPTFLSYSFRIILFF